jgi:ethanolamine ammonia-lyase small subunit
MIMKKNSIDLENPIKSRVFCGIKRLTKARVLAIVYV